MLPASVPKTPGTYDRAVPFEQTLALVPELRRRYGITRLADTTYLDRTGISTYSALVPNSPDLLGVYNGKGLTREAAMASAVMEATERQIGAAVPLAMVQWPVVRRETLRRHVDERTGVAEQPTKEDLTAMARHIDGHLKDEAAAFHEAHPDAPRHVGTAFLMQH